MIHAIAPRTIALAMLAVAGAAQTDGQPAPEIPFVNTFNFEGIKNQRLSDLQGSVVLIEFWGTH